MALPLTPAEARTRVTQVFKGVPVQPAYVTAIGDRAVKNLARYAKSVGENDVVKACEADIKAQKKAS